MSDSGWFVYLIRFQGGGLYTGITTNIERRFSEHSDGRDKGAKSLKGKGPLELVASVAVNNRSVASKVEVAIKKLPKSRKEQLVADPLAMQQLIKELSRD